MRGQQKLRETMDDSISQITQPSLWTSGVERAEEEKPENVKHLRERLQYYGTGALSGTELLSLILGTGSATPGVLREAQTLFASMPLPELFTVEFGELSSKFGAAKAAQIQAVFELARRLTLPPDAQRYQILSPADAAHLLMADMGY